MGSVGPLAVQVKSEGSTRTLGASWRLGNDRGSFQPRRGGAHGRGCLVRKSRGASGPRGGCEAPSPWGRSGRCPAMPGWGLL